MKKLLFLILALQFCGSEPDHAKDFETDFGSNKITFTRCDQNGASLVFDSTIEYLADEDRFILKGNGADYYFKMDQMVNVNSAIGNILWKTSNGVDPSVNVWGQYDGRVRYYYQDFVCFSE